jgi:hypothetical protein
VPLLAELDTVKDLSFGTPTAASKSEVFDAGERIEHRANFLLLTSCTQEIAGLSAERATAADGLGSCRPTSPAAPIPPHSLG